MSENLMDEHNQQPNISGVPTDGTVGIVDGATPAITRRVYWFLRLKDNTAIPIEGEKQASTYCYQRTYRQSFRYLGWSDGTVYDAAIRTAKKITKEEFDAMAKEKFAAAKESGQHTPVEYSLDEGRRQILYAGVKAEYDAMMANPDKTKPRSFQVTDLQGSPMATGMITEAIKMMGGN